MGYTGYPISPDLISGPYHLFRSEGRKAGVSIVRVAKGQTWCSTFWLHLQAYSAFGKPCHRRFKKKKIKRFPRHPANSMHCSSLLRAPVM